MFSSRWFTASVTLVLLSASHLAYSATYSFGANLGQLNYQQSHVTYTCWIQWTSNVQYPPPMQYTYYKDYFNSFVYVNSGVGTNQAIPGTIAVTWNSPGAGQGYTDNCPNNSNSGTINYQGTGYTIAISASNGTFLPVIKVPGYINPKYVVVGVLYAPPGHSSSVSYSTSNLVGSTVSTKNSYKAGYSVGSTATGGFSGGIKGWKGGTIDIHVTQSATHSQATTTTDSSAVTVQKQTSFQTVIPGPVCDYCGVDHDYDIILVWLNPVQLFTLTNGGVVAPGGYGFASLDQPGMDVYQVYAGELNGDLPRRQTTTTAFLRGWATTGINYSSGSGPALTAKDELNILLMDPFWNCTYKSPQGDGLNCAKPVDASFSGTVNTSGTTVNWVSGNNFNQLLTQGKIVINGASYNVASVNSATNVSLTSSAGTQNGVRYSANSRFTQTPQNVNFKYEQPTSGGQPVPTTYRYLYTTINATGTGFSHETTVEYGLETVFGFKIFGWGLQQALKQTWSMANTYETSSQMTSQNTSEATASITPPVCTIVSGVCSPTYPPAHAFNPISCSSLSLPPAFGQGVTMYLYEDNLFGSFLFEPYYN
jgi:hypothetical protein